MTQKYLGTYVDHVYEIVRLETVELDSVYGDYIQRIVGTFGLNALLDANLLESCGIMNGRQLYVLCEKGPLN